MNNKIQKGNTRTSSIDLTKANLSALKASLNKIELQRLFYQLVVFVLDGSDSMNREGIYGRSKGAEVDKALKGIVEKLQSSKHKSSFDINVWVYSDEVNEIIPKTVVDKINKEQDFNPCNYVQNERTYLAPALGRIEEIVLDYLQVNKDRNTQALVIILSDGALHDYQSSKETTDRLKKNDKVTIASYLFEDKEWKETANQTALEELRTELKSLSSSSTGTFTFFKSTVDPEEVRKHMIKSISEVSKIQ